MYRVIKFIDDNITERLSLEEVAARFGYSMWHFCSLFKRFTGKSFITYVNDKKMSRAALDILSGERVGSVSVKYGFDTTGGFNKAFLKKFGCYPKNFKKLDEEFHIKYKERQMKNFKLSDRAAYLRELVMNKKPHNERIAYSAVGLSALGRIACPAEADRMELAAAGLTNIIKKFPVIIDDGELIVGHSFPDYSNARGCDIDGSHLAINDTDECRRDLKTSGFTEEEIEKIIYDSKNPRISIAKRPNFSHCENTMDYEWASANWCIWKDHNILDYEAVLQLGFEGLYERVEAIEKKNGTSSLLTAAKDICKSASTLGERYAERVGELLSADDLTDERRAELELMRKTLLTVPRRPATSFIEAVQSLYFAHIITCFEDLSINANSLGRLDQILYPYYERDIAEGKITKEFAFEIILCLWLKLYRDYDVQQSCVGGVNTDGTSAINELSYLMLDATEQLGFVRCLSVRYSKDTPIDFIKRAVEVVGHVGMGVPFFFNDDVMIPALVGSGISLEDARGYSQIGCVETCIPGKSNPHAVSGKVGLLKAIEYTFFDGKSGISGVPVENFEAIPAHKLTTYEDFKGEVFRHIANLVDISCKNVIAWAKLFEKCDGKPYKSLLTEGCLETNRDFNSRGAKYDYYQVMLAGIPNLADSLAAMKKLVFTEKRYTLDEIIREIRENFPSEAIRQEFINKAPKYGNDIDEVDEIAAEIMTFACDRLDEATRKYGYNFHAQPFTFLWLVDHGKNTAATPDGRRKGENIAYSVSPMQGCDFEGLTSVFNSIAKLPSKRAPGTTSAIVEVDPQLFSDRNTEILAQMMLSIAQKGVANVQFNVTSVETLEDAKRNPEKHRNLAVRVSGFSQKFYLLNEALQDHIIARTKHKTM